MTVPNLAITATASLRAIAESPRRRVLATDRLLDAAALAIITVGVTLFLIARHALLAISAGTYSLPAGWTWVQRTDHLVAQSKLGLLLSGVGLLLGIIAAARHAWRASEERYEDDMDVPAAPAVPAVPAAPAEQPRQAA